MPDAGERDVVAPSALRPLLVAALAAGAANDRGALTADGHGPGRFVLAVTATAREAEDLTAALGAFLPPHSVATFPGWETLPHERLSPRSDTVGQRIAVLRRLAHPASDDSDVAGRSRSLSRRCARCCSRSSPGSATWSRCGSPSGDDADPEDVITRLVEIGYARVEMVSKRGELAVRGGLLDVFPPTEEHPLRIEFFGDTVDEIRVFKVADQRSAGQLRARPVGAALPGAAAHPVGPRPGQGARRQAPGRLRHPRQDRRRDHRRGDGGVRLRPRRPHGTAASITCRSAPWCSPATRSGSGPGPPSWSRPARSSSRRPGRARPRAARRRSTSAGRPSSRSRPSASTRPSSASRGGRWRRSASRTRPRGRPGKPRGTAGRQAAGYAERG